MNRRAFLAGGLAAFGAAWAQPSAKGGTTPERIALKDVKRLLVQRVDPIAGRCRYVADLGSRQVAQPILRARRGDSVDTLIENALPQPTTVHFHGLTLPEAQDGAGFDPIAPGTAKRVRFRVANRGGPFRRVTCGAIPSELIGSELFGPEQGAFPSAVTRRKGWFEQADGGTLFLDEIGELAPAAQVRLLRVVQESELVRVGGERPIKVNVRIVAATHRDLPSMVEQQTFREDLYYRLAVFPIVIPPLRDRPSDIRAFAEYFAERAANRFGLRQVPVSDDDVRLLADYHWPGNVREMAAVMDRAVLIGQGKTLSVTGALGQDARASTPSPARSIDAPRTRIAPLDSVIRQHIEAALDATNGRVEGAHGAARLLKINPHTLRARMRKLKIDWRQYRQRHTMDESE